ncbi:MAG: PilZ domain-containing protein [Nitrospinaceae bacterium]|jgi:hypothetical protein|nr:PilZ domain-containing protein [Nitrospinaceae bacterium]MBT3435263.1 PilZ domain-containing protein [Nitrospinaceae bacterium]MBT3822011.1 PilZ domain-containing protein [Nitrospinaceae bacterium]MBT4094503.1 PilZ domain-containing protein [Nitrospinaceae bacterium]MBT4429748.1 PilZ domain-containing protein [Nitrospinaceae bacterium]
MSSGAEQRQNVRYKLPVLIEAPELANDWLRPEDISLGGFMVHLQNEPTVGMATEGAIRVEKEVFSGRISVAWVKEDLSEDESVWNAGLLFRLPDEDQEDAFEKAVEKLRKKMSRHK